MTMEEKHFSNIKWDNFPQHMKTMLFEMMKSSHLTDVTLVCDDKIQTRMEFYGVKLV